MGAAVGNPWEVAGSHTAEVVEVRILAAADIGLEVGWLLGVSTVCFLNGLYELAQMRKG